MKFLITWPSGLKEERVQADCNSVEALAMCAWGTDYAGVQAHGVTIDVLDTDPDADLSMVPTSDTVDGVQVGDGAVAELITGGETPTEEVKTKKKR